MNKSKDQNLLFCHMSPTKKKHLLHVFFMFFFRTAAKLKY